MSMGFGAFGKTPSMGDFFRLDLPHGFIEPWDAWLQAGILRMRETLGDRWNDCYLSAPIWRFTVPKGQAGPETISGIIFASIDRVGRQYPLTLAAPVDCAHTALHHISNTPVFEALENVALASLDGDMTREAMAEELAPLAFSLAQMPNENLYSGGHLWRSPVPPTMLFGAETLDGNMGYWSSSLPGAHRTMQCASLPNSEQMLALFDLHSPLWAETQPEPVV